MYCELRQPKLVYLCRGQDKSHMTTDLVEYSSPLSEVMGLLESRAMGAGFGGQTAVLAKRRDGSTIPVRLDPGMTLQDLEEAVAQHERVRPTTLVFYQAQDGHLHVTVTPSHDASSDTYPVYARPVLPQRPMFTKPKGTGQPMAELVRELCIMP